MVDYSDECGDILPELSGVGLENDRAVMSERSPVEFGVGGC